MLRTFVLMFFLLPPFAMAASFNCANARTPLERAVCSDAELSVLDEQMAAAYGEALKKQGDVADSRQFLIDGQRAWLKDQLALARQLPTPVDSLRDMYAGRVAELKAWPAFPAVDAVVAGPTYRLTTIAKRFDFTLRMLDDSCEAGGTTGERTCEGAAQLIIRSKDATLASPQIINLMNVFVTLQPSGKPLANSARLYDYQGVINVGDFDFDGNEDFGIQTGNEGSYGGPSYDVYLFDRRLKRFVYSEGLSNLIMETLGFFQVDTAHKLLKTVAKSGCCYHEFTSYRVKSGEPVPVARRVEEVTADDKLRVTEERLVNGRWQSKVHYEKLSD